LRSGGETVRPRTGHAETIPGADPLQRTFPLMFELIE
jgi:hypothetical protein